METDERLEGAIDQILLARSTLELNTILRAIRSDFDVANIAYHAVSIPAHDARNAILIMTYEDAWVQRYTARDYFLVDPVVRAGVKGFLPLDWSEVDRSSPEAQQFFREADAHHVGREGMTLPVRGPAGERALFTVTSNLSGQEWKAKRLLCMRDFQILAHFLHNRAVELAGYRSKQAVLSVREVQCLERIATGRNVKQVASELGLSISAVNLYLRSARSKLKCASVAEAVVKATRVELL
ncbi:helix-turn-helix transcriptional regulator [Methylobacterium indicum]|uniref:helix-turn-helix transcriptional regulator n=1 Tax=Methylobacterium indicum TaxID=1775910 RepID=UPI0013F4ED18|nr:LuxR family transcriptional regulator [Methylobacterium indicum]